MRECYQAGPEGLIVARCLCGRGGALFARHVLRPCGSRPCGSRACGSPGLQVSVAPWTAARTGWREPAPSAMFERQGADQGPIWGKASRHGGLPNGFEAENPGRQRGPRQDTGTGVRGRAACPEAAGSDAAAGLELCPDRAPHQRARRRHQRPGSGGRGGSRRGGDSGSAGRASRRGCGDRPGRTRRSGAGRSGGGRRDQAAKPQTRRLNPKRMPPSSRSETPRSWVRAQPRLWPGRPPSSPSRLRNAPSAPPTSSTRQTS